MHNRQRYMINPFFPTQGMVQGRTFREKRTGRYLTVEEQHGVGEEGSEEVEVTWEKMSKSKYNGVEPNVRQFEIFMFRYIW